MYIKLFIVILRNITYNLFKQQVYEGTSRFQGAHALKIIGWDTNEAGINYWIVENSWGEVK